MNQEIRFVTAKDGTRIACALMGRGRPLVKAPNWLSHVGLDVSSPVWRHWWAELSNGRYLLRFDERGSGLSDWNVADMSFQRWVEDLESVVDQLHVDEFDLFGMSQGSAVAMEYAARHPERVHRLILYGALAKGWAKRGGPQSEEHESSMVLMKHGWGSDNPAYRQLFTSQFMPDATLEQMKSFNELQRLSTSPENAVRFQVEVGKVDISTSLPNITAPTIVFHCREDARVPFDEGRRVAASIPGAKFVPLPSRSHILLETDPAWPVFRDEFRTFLSEAQQAWRAPSPPDASRDPREALTSRELEVLRLVARGHTDRQIAEELFISVRTAGNHLKSILAKTGCANRTAAAVFATTHGLI